MGVAKQDVGVRPELRKCLGRKSGRAIQCVALFEIDENGRNSAILPSQIDTGNYVRLVFLARKGGSLAVGARLRERIDRQSADAAIGVGIGMKRNEQVRMPGSCNVAALAKRDIDVAVARQVHRVVAVPRKLMGETQAFIENQVENQVLLHESIHPARPGIDASVARIDNNHLLLLRPVLDRRHE